MNIPLNIDWQQILLHLLNFAILAGGLYLLLYKPVKAFMAKRTAYYQELEDAARQKTGEAERLKSQYEDRLARAEEDIRQERTQAQQALQQTTQQQLDEAQRQADEILADARRTAERDRARILQDAQREIRTMALTAAEKLVLQSGGDAIDRFLDTAEREAEHGQQSQE